MGEKSFSYECYFKSTCLSIMVKNQNDFDTKGYVPIKSQMGEIIFFKGKLLYKMG